jgi:hypothetical protein
MKQNFQQIDFVSPSGVSRLFSDSGFAIGVALKVPLK